MTNDIEKIAKHLVQSFGDYTPIVISKERSKIPVYNEEILDRAEQIFNTQQEQINKALSIKTKN